MRSSVIVVCLFCFWFVFFIIIIFLIIIIYFLLKSTYNKILSFLVTNFYYLNVITVTKLAVFQHDVTKCENNLLHRWRPDGPWTVQIIPVVHRIAFTLYHTISRHQLVPMAISYSFCIKVCYFVSMIWKNTYVYGLAGENFKTSIQGEKWDNIFGWNRLSFFCTI